MTSVSSTVRAEPRVRVPDLCPIVSSLHLHGVLSLLLSSPSLLTISLSLSQSLVFSLHSEHHIILLNGGFVLKHSSHASDGVSLLSIGLLFSAVSGNLFYVLTVLLITPLLLNLAVGLHALLVYYKLINEHQFTYTSPLLRTV